MGGAGADDFVAGSLSSCLTISVGGSGSFFTSTVAKEQRGTSKRGYNVNNFKYKQYSFCKIK